MSIRCWHCKERHSTVAEVRSCAGIQGKPAQAPVTKTPPASEGESEAKRRRHADRIEVARRSERRAFASRLSLEDERAFVEETTTESEGDPWSGVRTSLSRAEEQSRDEKATTDSSDDRETARLEDVDEDEVALRKRRDENWRRTGKGPSGESSLTMSEMQKRIGPTMSYGDDT